MNPTIFKNPVATLHLPIRIKESLWPNRKKLLRKACSDTKQYHHQSRHFKLPDVPSRVRNLYAAKKTLQRQEDVNACNCILET